MRFPGAWASPGSGAATGWLRPRGWLPRVCLPVMLAALLVVPARPSGSAATVARGFTNTRVTGGLTNPTAMELAPDGRVFVAEQRGALRVVKRGRLLPRPFLDISGKVDPRGERGLLGVAFDPAFARTRYVYIYYTRRATSTARAHNRVARFRASGDRVVPGSERLILRLNDLSAATNHNGGAIHFGKDGRLYIAVGDNANGSNSQRLTNLLGKVLRVDRGGGIPASNPFYRRARGKNRAIWALGLRNPYNFAVQRGTGKIYINDVGQGSWEEINRGVAGANYGWPYYEGSDGGDRRYRDPIYQYGHGSGNSAGCSIVGGAFYNPVTRQFPRSYVGDYFYADYCGGWIRSYDAATDTSSLFRTGVRGPVDIKVGRGGGLWYLARSEGVLYRVGYRP